MLPVMTNTLFTRPADLKLALACARGTYQRALVMGERKWSGADLAGAAKRSGGHYAEGRRNLLARMRAAGLVVETRYLRGNRKMVVVGPRVRVTIQLTEYNMPEGEDFDAWASHVSREAMYELPQYDVRVEECGGDSDKVRGLEDADETPVLDFLAAAWASYCEGGR